jgi:hypothetical protein
MQFDLLEAAVRLLMLTAIPSILASAALIAILACRQKFSGFFGISSANELDYDPDAVMLVFFAIVEFSLTGSAIIFGLVKHLLLR